ncbi:SRPBCC family protein [Photobacterium leiognathi]|uniref:SRPBCC family protein n=1 Tax=Photobacterium leiognathi TaxID=553611 RepID=UPI00298119A2|nr:SRPBCC family protein [Photobacterium leiognathi]
MTIHTVTLEVTANVPKKVLFALLSDHAKLGRFFNAQYTLVRSGKPEENGIGAIREVIHGPFTYQEQVIDYKENEHIHYQIIHGAPVNEHGGWIKFTSINATQSQIHYHITFSPKIKGTGWLLKYQIQHFLKQALNNLIQHSEDVWQSTPTVTPYSHTAHEQDTISTKSRAK